MKNISVFDWFSDLILDNIFRSKHYFSPGKVIKFRSKHVYSNLCDLFFILEKVLLNGKRVQDKST